MVMLQNFKKGGTRTPFFLGFEARKGICPSVHPLRLVGWTVKPSPHGKKE